jgi:hypothetical protein
VSSCSNGKENTVDKIREGIKKAKKYEPKSGMAIGCPIRKLPKEFKKYYP